MRIVIDTKDLSSNDVSKEAVLAYMAELLTVDIEKAISIQKSKSEASIIHNYKKKFIKVHNGDTIIEALNKSGSTIPNSKDSKYYLNNLEETASRMKELFPKGKKGKTNISWTDSVPLIGRRLTVFSQKYPGTYTVDEIVDATRRYVNSFNGDYTFMRVLKYFIFKDEVKAGNVDYTSELLNYLEDKEEVSYTDSSWTDELI